MFAKTWLSIVLTICMCLPYKKLQTIIHFLFKMKLIGVHPRWSRMTPSTIVWMPVKFYTHFGTDQYNGFTLLSLQSRYFCDIFGLFICRSYPSQTRRKYHTYYINYFTGSGFAYARDKLHSSRTSKQTNFYRLQTNFAKVMFSQVFVCPQGWSLLSREVSVQRGISAQKQVSVQGRCLCSEGVSVQRECLSRQVCVQGGLCTRGFCPGGLCPRRPLSKGVSDRETPLIR